LNEYARKEAAIRRILSEQLKTSVIKKKLVYAYDKNGLPRIHEFDLVANTENGLLVGEVKSSSYRNETRYWTTKFWRVLGACVYLERVEASQKILVLTEREFFEHFKVDAEGLISEDIKVKFIQVSDREKSKS